MDEKSVTVKFFVIRVQLSRRLSHSLGIDLLFLLAILGSVCRLLTV
jgi:hypothetical protein